MCVSSQKCSIDYSDVLILPVQVADLDQLYAQRWMSRSDRKMLTRRNRLLAPSLFFSLTH